MKIFITGSTGFIGKHLCKKLHEDGHTLIALVRSPHKLAGMPKMEIIEGDMRVFQDPTLVLPPCDIVIHLAGVIAAEKEADYIDINYAAVVDMVKCIQRQNWVPDQFLFASSLAAAGPTQTGRALTEKDPCNPIEPYGIAKLKTEAFLDTVNFPTTSFRPGVVLGPGDTATLTLYKMASKGLGIRPSGTQQQVSCVYVSDLVNAISLMMSPCKRGVLHRKYFVVNNEIVLSTALFQEIGRELNKSIRIIVIPRKLLKFLSVMMTGLSKLISFRNQLDEKQYQQIVAEAFTCSSQLLQNDLEWQPEYDLKASIKASIAGYRKMGWLP